MINLIHKRQALELAKKKKINIVIEWSQVGSFYTVIARNIDNVEYNSIVSELEEKKEKRERKRKRLQERQKYVESVFTL